MELEVRHLRALVTIADQGSITKAAQTLGLSQPSLTAQLRRIENTVGGPLFDRSRRGVTPTALGRSVISRARSLVAEMDDFRELGQAGLRQRELRIGSPPGVLLPQAVRGIVERCGLAVPGGRPAIVVSVHPDTGARMLSQVQTGGLHAVIVMEMFGFPVETPPDVRRTTVIPYEPCYVALSESHPLAKRDVIDLRDLAGERWLTDATDDLLDLLPLRAAARAAGFEPDVDYQLTDINSARAFIASGECVSLAQALSRQDRGIAVRPLAGNPIAQHIDLAWSDRCPADPQLIVEALREAYDAVVEQVNPPYRAWYAQNRDQLELPAGHARGTPPASRPAHATTNER